MTPLLELTGVGKTYRPRADGQVSPGWRRRLPVAALSAVSLSLDWAECLAVVGESGSGKTTLGRCAIRLIEPDSGAVRFDGEDLLGLSPAALRRRRRRFQMVFQDPLGALNPRRRVRATLEEPLDLHIGLHGSARDARVEELLAVVGLDGGLADQYPHQLSGGQRQRVGIARALAPEPDLLVADEPVSALDASVRAHVLNLLAALQASRGLAVLLIAHDLAMVEQAADRVAVLYLGHVVELAPSASLFALPLHPYTVSLLSAVPQAVAGARRERILLRGEAASSTGVPAGCPFHPRCPIARARCRNERPLLVEQAPAHSVACFYAGELERPGSVNFAVDRA